MYVCVCVCMYVCMYVLLTIFLCATVFLYVQKCLSVCMPHKACTEGGDVDDVDLVCMQCGAYVDDVDLMCMLCG